MARSRKTQSSTISTSTTSASASASTPTTTSVRARKKLPVNDKADSSSKPSSGNGPVPPEEDSISTMPSWATGNRWIVYAIASGACAAFNGVFAKLTTNELSTHIAQGISGFLRLTNMEGFVEVVVRCAFFGLNLAFNGVMWTLFTQALAKGQSTTQVSIMNTSTNFVITALLGLAIFAESLPPLWWVGATMLIAGNVIIGRGKQEEGDAAAGEGEVQAEYHDNVEDVIGSVREDEGHGSVDAAELGQAPPSEAVLPVEKDSDDEDVAHLGDLSQAT